MRWLLLAIGLFSVFALPAGAAPDAYGAWKKGAKTFDKREAEYWDRFDGRLRRVYEEWTSQWRLWRQDPDGYKDDRVSLDGIRELYDEYVELQADRSEVHKSLARSNHAKALAVLFDELMDLAKDVDRLEKELAEARPTGGRSQPRYEQAAPVRRHGLATAREGLLDALALVPGSAAFLVDAGLAEATKGDKKRSIYRRTAVMDALGRLDDETARGKLSDALRAPEPFMRILAIENLAGRGPDVIALVEPLMDDPVPAVRRAAFDAVRERGLDIPAWIEVLLRRYEKTRGVDRVRLIAALEALSGLRVGDDAEVWSTWYEGVKASVADGTFERPKPEDEEDPKEGDEGENAAEETEDDGDEALEPELPEVEARVSFYGVRSPSVDLILLVDGSRMMDLPASLEVQTKRANSWWRQTGPKWKESEMDHHAFLLQQLAWTLEALPEGAHFGVVHLQGSTPNRLGVMGGKKLLRPSKGARKSVLKTVRKSRPEGLLSCQEGLAQALRMCGGEDCRNPKPDAVLADTVYLVNTGTNGGRYPLPEILRAWWKRANRFHRLTVHAIRICDEKEEAETLMKGLAADSVGTYLWLTEL